MMDEVLVVELLDPDLKYAIQTWRLENGQGGMLGRGSDCDVLIRNPYVSRAHAYFEKRSQGWFLNAISELGLVVNGRIEKLVEIAPEAEFRLSRKGPLLRARIVAVAAEPCTSGGGDSLEGMATIGEQDFGFPILRLDAELRDEEVAAIEQQDYFQKLQLIARKRRNANSQ